mmetsp:Transcript_25065/g.72503  ORF Transcript_25065/g.72503 Transcript_25065/m.72503 type:complete len:283 (-) Transcript_25065:717-1565(-)
MNGTESLHCPDCIGFIIIGFLLQILNKSEPLESKADTVATAIGASGTVLQTLANISDVVFTQFGNKLIENVNFVGSLKHLNETQRVAEYSPDVKVERIALRIQQNSVECCLGKVRRCVKVDHGPAEFHLLDDILDNTAPVPRLAALNLLPRALAVLFPSNGTTFVDNEALEVDKHFERFHVFVDDECGAYLREVHLYKFENIVVCFLPPWDELLPSVGESLILLGFIANGIDEKRPNKTHQSNDVAFYFDRVLRASLSSAPDEDFTEEGGSIPVHADFFGEE